MWSFVHRSIGIDRVVAIGHPADGLLAQGGRARVGGSARGEGWTGCQAQVAYPATPPFKSRVNSLSWSVLRSAVSLRT